jgi:maltose alpha-D-glucosyltransferase/alpha-amylase
LTPTSADEIARFLAGPGKAALAEFLSRQRWFAAKARGIGAVSLEDWAPLRPPDPPLLVLLNVDGDRYYVPLSATPRPPNDVRRRVAQCGELTICDAHWDPDFARLLLQAIASSATLVGSSGRFWCRPMEPWSGPPAGDIASGPVRPLEGEQSNTSLLFDRALILKSIRRPQDGINPDLEITRFLTSRTTFPDAAQVAGWIEYAHREAPAATIAVLQHFVENTGDGWEYMLAGLRHLCEVRERDGEIGVRPSAAAARGPCGRADDLVEQIRALGTVTGGLHAALASDSSLADFRPEKITDTDVSRWRTEIIGDAERLYAELAVARASVDTLEPALSALDRLAERTGDVVRNLQVLADGQTCKIRCHGDYHLGQVLKTANAFLVIDFEGEPARPLAERRRKHAALRDVAGMLRSLNYAVHAVARARAAEGRAPLLGWLGPWEAAARRAFLDGYVAAVSNSPVRLIPGDAAQLAQVCAVFELEKACYELRYELNNRPDWIAIPLAGISRILAPM